MPQLGVIDKELCRPTKCGHECEKACPINRKGELCIVVRKKAVIDESLCIGCHLCIKPCPFNAVNIINLPEQLTEQPVHRFGENEFSLFRLPIPVKGVVGLLGPNGVGKTTALRILSGQLSPSSSELEIKYKGTEMQNYLENISSVRSVYKPQSISMIPKLVKKTVREILDLSMIKKMDLQAAEDRLTTELSGGELQRLAIGQTLSKDGDIYFFDEPSSYLDVKQRLNVAKAIRELAEEKFVMVVEHDLATLDFLAERIHIFYGVPSAYGVVSKPYSVRTGINAFLRGFIKEDNMRIRDPTVFEEVTEEKGGLGSVLTSFSGIKKDYNSFSLSVDQGEIHEGEVLGIFGSNALGKTTFAKILAGIIKSEGEISNKIKISYKPQYIDSDFEGTVEDLLQDVPEIIRRGLELDRLDKKTVKNLSGGELQRVSIAICLKKDADLYLLDEPSAYLDVDQRLAVARLLRNRTAMVIDHDLLFLSYISDRAMLFSGQPGIRGNAEIMDLKSGFNKFLKDLQITFRRDPETKRIRANKTNSQKDVEQKQKGEYFYTS